MASLLAYRAGEFSNSYVLAKMKIWTHGNKFRSRALGSTVVGEGIDTVLFTVIAFAGSLPNPILISIMLSNYIFKLVVEAVLLPITYKIVAFLKKAENEDYYDTQTDFNPFTIQ